MNWEEMAGILFLPQSLMSSVGTGGKREGPHLAPLPHPTLCRRTGGKQNFHFYSFCSNHISFLGLPIKFYYMFYYKRGVIKTGEC